MTGTMPARILRLWVGWEPDEREWLTEFRNALQTDLPGRDDTSRPVRLASARELERRERHRRPGDRPKRGLRNEKGNPGAPRDPVSRTARGTDRDPANRGRVEHHRSIRIAPARRGGSRAGEGPMKEDTALAHWSNAVEGLESSAKGQKRRRARDARAEPAFSRRRGSTC